MKTLLVGTREEPLEILRQALSLRNHEITIAAPDEDALELLGRELFPLVILVHLDDKTLHFARSVRTLRNGHRATLMAVLDTSQIDKLNEVLEAGIDQCIVESLYDEIRLDIRLAFAEKLAQEKREWGILEQKLRDSEARYRSIVETSVDAIITINDRGHVLTFNRAAQKLFQYSASEVIGRNVHMLMPEPYSSEHDDYMNNYLTTGKKKIIGIGREVSGKRQDGTTFPMYLAVSETFIRDKRVFTGIIRDISSERRLEKEILQISEHERRRIGQDLHDGLGQMLTGIGLITRNIASQLEKAEHPLYNQAEEVVSLIRDADQYARELTRGLVPVEFDNEGLNTALERLTDHAKKLFGIECTFQSNSVVQTEDSSGAVQLYRIAQESVSNAVKHGGATSVHIRVDGFRDFIRLQIQDNGTGFDKDWDKKGGLGVRIMQFRAGLIGANLEISDAKEGGALITCNMPQDSIGAENSHNPGNT
ncbi:MAG: PAS domain S-box protein [Balneolaceae bacterium]